MCSGGNVVAIYGCSRSICPVFDVSVAREQQSTNGLAGNANGALGDSIELMYVCWRECTGGCVVIAELEKSCADKLASVVGVYRFNCAIDGGTSDVGNGFEVSEEPFGPFRSFAFELHRVKPGISSEVVDAEEKVLETTNCLAEWARNVAEYSLARTRSGAFSCRSVG